ncbi:FtsB family cell division protein [Flavobacterium silvaticum]|uniref:Septum formation initiator family protein n=1 Tax=Flavobacterium silvaticum TaxID=1852020 RepID=A0A972FQ78_9FLAO|nr:septum formation initiator family protein [Flavobacterium silvaticum]NMH29350.1 septum formation initiator family protein [Flavobacterium silvaticum]
MEPSEHENEPKEPKKRSWWLRYFGNRYVLSLVFFAVWMLFLDNYSWLVHRRLDTEIDELETNKRYYQGEINKDMQHIKQLRDSDQVERYAREKYYMKRDSEDIYIIEYEGEKKDSTSFIPN